MEIVLSSVVMLGEGFTPLVFTAKALRGVIDDEPDVAAASPTLAILQYSSGYQILVNPNRIEVKKENPPPGEDQLMQQAFLRVVSQWPLAEIRAVGLNFAFIEQDASAQQRVDIRRRFTDEPRVVAVLGSELTGASFTYVTQLHGARVQVTLDSDVARDDVKSLGLRVNVHYSPIEDVGAACSSQDLWYQQALAWGREFFHGS